jgi:hypothetical protein
MFGIIWYFYYIFIKILIYSFQSKFFGDNMVEEKIDYYEMQDGWKKLVFQMQISSIQSLEKELIEIKKKIFSAKDYEKELIEFEKSKAERSKTLDKFDSLDSYKKVYQMQMSDILIDALKKEVSKFKGMLFEKDESKHKISKIEKRVEKKEKQKKKIKF